MPVHPILYDADCGFCRVMLAGVLAWDRHRRLRPVALQDPEADRLLAAMPDPVRYRSWHLVTPDGRVHSGGHVFAPLLRLLPGGAPLAVLPGAAPALADRAYHLVAGRRNRLGPWIPPRLKERARERIAERAATA